MDVFIFSSYLPMILCFIAGVGFSIQGFVFKLLTMDGYKNSMQIIFFRGCVQTILGIIFVIREVDRNDTDGKSLFGDSVWVRCVIICRCLFGFSAGVFAFLGLINLPLGDNTVLVMLTPLLASIGAFIFLKEPFRRYEQLAAFVSLLGVIMIAQPAVIFGVSTDSNGVSLGLNVMGVGCALTAAVSGAGVFLALRMLGTSAKMPWPNVILAHGLSQVLLAPPLFHLTGQDFQTHFTPRQILMIFTCSVIGGLSQIAVTYGLQREKSALAGALRMSEVVFSFIWQGFFTKDPLNPLSLLGAVLVTTSILLVLVMKMKEDKSKSLPVAVDKDISQDIPTTSPSPPSSSSSSLQLFPHSPSSLVEVTSSLSLLKARWSNAATLQKIVRAKLRRSTASPETSSGGICLEDVEEGEEEDENVPLL